jgi:hypothetical protein
MLPYERILPWQSATPKWMHWHSMEHVISLWAAKSSALYLLKQLWSWSKIRFLDFAFDQMFAFPISILLFPYEWARSIGRVFVRFLLFAGAIGALVFVLKRVSQMPATC